MNHYTYIACLYMFFSVTVSGSARSQQTLNDPLSVDVADHMLELAGVNGRDTLYDIGSGDERIVIGAAKRYGAYGVGIDISSSWPQQIGLKAQEALVGDRVRFLRGTAAHADLHSATVVLLRLSQKQNLSLRTQLLEQLRPGTRIVSSRADLGEWEPDRCMHLGQDRIYFWIVPANVSGRWEWEVDREEISAKIKQDFQHIRLSVRSDNWTSDTRFDIMGNRVSFSITATDSSHYSYTGVVEDNTITGFVLTPSGSWYPWEAKRRRSSAEPIDIQFRTQGNRS
ncbi:MAG: SAM-dependent methyltransferase [Chitinivibrionales bacterium]